MQHEYSSEEKPEDESDMDESQKSAKSEGGWHSTNVTVVARGDALKVEEALPAQTEEGDYDYGDDDEETAMKSIDEDFSALIKRTIEQNAEVLKRFAEIQAKAEAGLDVVVDEILTEEVKPEESKSEEQAEVSEPVAEPVAEPVNVVEEVKSENGLVEETKTEVDGVEAAAEVVPNEVPTTEKKTSISFDDLKEFHNLLKEINK